MDRILCDINKKESTKKKDRKIPGVIRESVLIILSADRLKIIQ